VIAAAGSGIAFLLNAVSFFGVIYFLYQWKRQPGRTTLRATHMTEAMFDGLRHMRGSSEVKSVLVRSAVFSISASALPALLPLLAHPFGSQGYGLLLGFFGLGALLGAALMPFFRRTLSTDVLVSVATVVFAFTTYAGGRWHSFPVLSVTMFVAGVAWIQVLASLNVSAQTMCPGHMRARAISMYLLVLQGGLAGGAALWGEIAEKVGMERSLLYAALGLLMGILAAAWFKLRPSEMRANTVGMD
jgi:predicted MFS family arabinose efflux permease